MIVTAWSNGSPNYTTGGGYGIRLSRRERDAHFRPEWPSVVVELEGARTITVNLAPSFWRRCTELKSAAIGKWLLDHELAPWPKGSPPKLKLEPRGDRRFRLTLVT